MKKIFTLVVLLLTLVCGNVAGQASTPLFYDFENAEENISRLRSPGWTNNIISRVQNPLSDDAINSSAYVLEVRNSNLIGNSGFMMLDLNQQGQVTDVSQYNRLEFKIYRGGVTNSKVAIQYNGAGDNLLPVDALSSKDGWQLVEFEIPAQYYNAHAFRLLFESTQTTDAVYIDDFKYYEASATGTPNVNQNSSVEIFPVGSGRAVVAFEVDKESQVEVCVYAVAGSLIDCAADERYVPGRHQVELSFPQKGVYIVSVKTDEHYTRVKYLAR